MPNSDYCIVAVTYSRLSSLKILLESLLGADYGGHEIDLLVSIDKGPAEITIKQYCEAFDWPFGNFSIRTFPHNLGLRNHILKCGSIVQDYKAVFVFEDDIIVGPDFFNFARSAIEKYGEDQRIAGISLYAPSFNEMARLPFEPAPSGYDAFFLQSAQSWGQCWTKEMWEGFFNWYQQNSSDLVYEHDMPDRIYSWPDSSWKKYAMKYLAVKNLTWLFPYISHTSNRSEIGTHNQAETAMFQVALSRGTEKFVFPDWEDAIKYDIYFERMLGSIKVPEAADQEVLLDLYGTRQSAKGVDCLITPRTLGQKVIAQYRLERKPHEINILNKTYGEDLFLYKLNNNERILLSDSPRNKNIGFYTNLIWQDCLLLGLQGLKKTIARKLKKFIN